MCSCEQSICWRRARPVEPPSGPCRRRADSVTGWCDVSTCQPTRARPKLTVKRSSSGEVLSFRPDDVCRTACAAATPPPPNVRSAWPTRDIAIVETLAHCGVRVSELIGLTVASVERDRQQPLLEVRAGAKGGKPRNVRIPRRTLAAIDSYLDVWGIDGAHLASALQLRLVRA
jgi:integrase